MHSIFQIGQLISTNFSHGSVNDTSVYDVIHEVCLGGGGLAIGQQPYIWCFHGFEPDLRWISTFFAMVNHLPGGIQGPEHYITLCRRFVGVKCLSTGPRLCSGHGVV